MSDWTRIRNICYGGKIMKSFNNWWIELKKLYSYYYTGLSLDIKDIDDWREFYDEGFTPKEAIFEDSRS